MNSTTPEGTGDLGDTARKMNIKRGMSVATTYTILIHLHNELETGHNAKKMKEKSRSSTFEMEQQSKHST